MLLTNGSAVITQSTQLNMGDINDISLSGGVKEVVIGCEKGIIFATVGSSGQLEV